MAGDGDRSTHGGEITTSSPVGASLVHTVTRGRGVAGEGGASHEVAGDEARFTQGGWRTTRSLVGVGVEHVTRGRGVVFDGEGAEAGGRD